MASVQSATQHFYLSWFYANREAARDKTSITMVELHDVPHPGMDKIKKSMIVITNRQMDMC